MARYTDIQGNTRTGTPGALEAETADVSIQVPLGLFQLLGVAPSINIIPTGADKGFEVPSAAIGFAANAPIVSLVPSAALIAAQAAARRAGSSAGSGTPRPRRVIVGSQAYRMNYNDGRHVVFGPTPTGTPPKAPPRNQRPTPRMMMAANGGNQAKVALTPSRKTKLELGETTTAKVKIR